MCDDTGDLTVDCDDTEDLTVSWVMLLESGELTVDCDDIRDLTVSCVMIFVRAVRICSFQVGILHFTCFVFSFEGSFD